MRWLDRRRTTVTVSAPAFREVLPIAPRAVTIDFITHSRKYVIVELDPNLTLQDFNGTPGIWRLVMQDRNKAPLHGHQSCRWSDRYLCCQ